LDERFHTGRHAKKSLWLSEQFEAIEEAFEESNLDPGKIADALIRIEGVLDFLGD
jgi:hypothetical protein